MTLRRALHALFSTAFLLGLGWGCSAADSAGGASPSGGGNNGIAGKSNDPSVIKQEAGTQDTGHLGLNPLCGTPELDFGCVPDLPDSCGSYVPPVMSSGDAGSGEAGASASSEAGAIAEGGAAGDGAGPANSSSAGEGGTSGASSELGAAGAAEAAGASGAPPMIAPKYSCQVQRSPTRPDTVFAGCIPVGAGGENAPCLTSADCQATLGCVGDRDGGLCQKYCCQDANDCEKGSYCAERPLRDATVNALPKGSTDPSSTLFIPVCVHAENCDLSEPYPCAKGSDCACKSGTACLVVRADGTTTCGVPGTGKLGEACPCAWGHICSAATNQCLKLCRTQDTSPCGDGKCQSASELPDGWGVCIGMTSDAG